jgi:hypothetical protein
MLQIYVHFYRQSDSYGSLIENSPCLDPILHATQSKATHCTYFNREVHAGWGAMKRTREMKEQCPRFFPQCVTFKAA